MSFFLFVVLHYCFKLPFINEITNLLMLPVAIHFPFSIARLSILLYPCNLVLTLSLPLTLSTAYHTSFIVFRHSFKEDHHILLTDLSTCNLLPHLPSVIFSYASNSYQLHFKTNLIPFPWLD